MGIVPTVDGDFMALLPEPTEEENALLRELIMEAGEARDAIVCWDSPGYPILDGHHRYDICVNEGLPYTVKLLKLPDRDACKLWMLRNQRGRRNLTKAQWSLIRGNEYQLLKGQKGGNHGTKAKSEKTTLLDAAAKVAADHHVHRSTVLDDSKFVGDVAKLAEKSPKLASAVQHGDIPRSNVAAIADAPKATVKKLEQTPAKELKKAAAATAKKQTGTKPAKNGKPSYDPARFKTLYDYVGHAIPKLTALNKEYNSSCYERAKRCLSEALQHIDDWRKQSQP